MVVAVPTPSASSPPLYHRLPCPYTLATLDTVTTTITIIGTIHPPYRTEKLLCQRRRPTVAATAAGDMAIAHFPRSVLLLEQTRSSGSGSMQLMPRILEQSQCTSYRMLL